MAAGIVEAEENPGTVALGNPLILKKIFSCLPFNDLKQCRLVNKIWKFDAGSYIRDFRRCHVSISDVNFCSDLYDLNELISKMDVVPINSLSFGFGVYTHSVCKVLADESNVYSELIGKMSLKYLKIGDSACFGRENECPGFPFVISLYREKLKELRALEINFFGYTLLEGLCHGCTPMLPKLTTLDVGMGWVLRKDLFLKLINGAPNLKKLKGKFGISDLKHIPQEKHCLINSFNLSVSCKKDEEKCWKLIETRPMLSQLSLIAPRRRQNRQGFFKILKELMAINTKTLEKIDMSDQVFPLTRLSFRPMVNLKTLAISTGGDMEQVLNVLRSTDYSERLPALAEIKIDQYFDYNSQELNTLEYTAAPAQPTSSASITKLNLSIDTKESLFQGFSLVFPNVTELIVMQPEMEFRTEILYDHLWAHWPLLESIYLTEESSAENFDAEFLGIYPEEAEILMEESDESLETMNIVPIRPCILTMPRLKSLKIRFDEWEVDEDEDEDFLDQDEIFLSRVTGILAFRKLTEMGVRIQIVSRCPETVSNLAHLMPFASVMVDNDDEC